MAHIRLVFRVAILVLTSVVLVFTTAQVGMPAASGEQRVIEFKGGGTDRSR